MKSFLIVASIWKLWNICLKDFQFRWSKNPRSTSGITIQVMWSCFVTTSALHFCQHSFTFPTLASLLNCLADPSTASFLFSFILIIFIEKLLLKRISLRLKQNLVVTELLSSILKNEILKGSIFYQQIV